MIKKKTKNKKTFNLKSERRGFSLIECVIALLILMVTSLAIISVLHYTFKSSESARKRMAAMLLAENQLETLRNTKFINLTAGTTTQQNVVYDGIKYVVVITITDTDILFGDTAAGPEEKQVTITVSPNQATLNAESVTLTTARANNRPGPNKEVNNP